MTVCAEDVLLVDRTAVLTFPKPLCPEAVFGRGSVLTGNLQERRWNGVAVYRLLTYATALYRVPLKSIP